MYKKIREHITKMIALFMGILMIGSSIPAQAASYSTVTVKGKYLQTEARSITSMVNKFRRSNAWYYNSKGGKSYAGTLKNLTYDYNLEKIAMKRAAEIAVSYGHKRPTEKALSTAYSEANYKFTGLGENIAYGQKDATTVFESWREDNEDYKGQGHRRNMLGIDYNPTKIGIACYELNGIKFWVQEFSAGNTDSSKKTAANNSSSTQKIKVLTSAINPISVTPATKNITIKAGSLVNKPTFSTNIRVTVNSKAAVCPVSNGAFNYHSNNSKIVAFKNHMIYAKKKGTTTITVKSLTYPNAAPATIKVTVK